MPWKESSVVEERARFVLEYERGLCSMAELCRRYGVSRETGYVWTRRYEAEGIHGLQDHNRAPHRPGNRTPSQIEAAVLELRREHMRCLHCPCTPSPRTPDPRKTVRNLPGCSDVLHSAVAFVPAPVGMTALS